MYGKRLPHRIRKSEKREKRGVTEIEGQRQRHIERVIKEDRERYSLSNWDDTSQIMNSCDWLHVIR